MRDTPAHGTEAHAPAALVGRRPELDTARRLVARAGAGEGGTLLVTGEAGIGKSRLLAELCGLATDIGLDVHRGRAVHGGGAYRPVAEALAASLRRIPALDAGAAARLAPYRAALTALAPGWVGNPDGGLRNPPALAGVNASGDAGAGGVLPDPAVVLGEGLLALLAAIRTGRASLLVLEDLHWADADTLDLTSYLADAVVGEPVLLAMSARDDSASAVLRAWGLLLGRPTVTWLRLARLGRDEVAALATIRRGGRPLPEPELDVLVDRSDGLPLLVEELLLQPHAPGGDAAVPPSLAALMAARLGGLPERAREVVVAAAVAPGPPDRRLLAEVTGLPGREVLAALRSATDAGVLVSDGAELRFRHALTRDAVLASLLPPERQDAAARIAGLLRARDEPGDLAAAAELLLLAGDTTQAADALLALALREASEGALGSAAQRLARAAGTGRLPVRVATERVGVLTLLGRAAEALAVGEAALRAAHPVGDEHAELCLRLARAAVAGGRWGQARRWIDRAGRPEDPRALVLAADAAYGAGDTELAGVLALAADTALTAGTALTADTAAVRCEALLVLARARTGADLTESTSYAREAARLAGEHGLTPLRAQALFTVGARELTDGDPSAPALAEARRLAEECGMLAQVAQADLLRADARLTEQGPAPALDLHRATAARAGRLRQTSLQAMAEVMGAAAAALGQDRAAAEQLLDAATSRPDRSPDVLALATVTRALPHLLAGDVHRAAALVDAGVEPVLAHRSAAPIWHYGLWALLRTAADDRGGEARSLLRDHPSRSAATNRAGLSYAHAIAAGRRGDGAEAATRFAEAGAVLARMPWWNRLLRAVVLGEAVRDGWGDPVPALRADLTIHERTGDVALARWCRDLLRAAGAPTRRGRGSGSVAPALRALGITAREADVLELIDLRLSNDEIAARLYLSRRTVETHVARLLAKTGTADRAALRAWSHRTGARHG